MSVSAGVKRTLQQIRDENFSSDELDALAAQLTQVAARKRQKLSKMNPKNVVEAGIDKLSADFQKIESKCSGDWKRDADHVHK